MNHIHEERDSQRLTYLASPYTHPDPAVRQWRFEAACRLTATLMRAGQMVFSPVVHSHPLTRYGLPKGWDFWRRYDRIHLERCSELAVLMLDGWRESKGVTAEINIAWELDKPVRYLDAAPLIQEIAKSTPALCGTGVEEAEN